VYDSRHNRHYYFNTTTGSSQWVRPKGVVVADAQPEVQEKADKALMARGSELTAAGGTSGPSVTTGPDPDDEGAGGGQSAADRAARAGAANGSDKTARGGARKLRSIAKGMANLLGLRRRHAGKEGDEGDAVTSNPLAAVASADDAEAAAGASASASSGAEAGAVPTPGPGGLKRTMSAGEIKPQLKRTRSILKRSSTMHIKREDRRISFADQAGKELANVVYCDNLHYSQQPTFGAAVAAHSHDEDDAGCAVM